MKKTLIVALALVFTIGIFAPSAHAGSTPLNGWAWSSNVGWIQFDTDVAFPVILSTTTTTTGGDQNSSVINAPILGLGTGGGGTTTVDPVATLSGYAWGSNIGWISFNTGDVANCPSVATPSLNGTDAQLNGCVPSVNIVTGAVTGWARILSSTAPENGGGWIQLSGLNHLTVPNLAGSAVSNQGVSYNKNSNSFSGYSYEPYSLGWVDFNATLTSGGNGNNGVCLGTCGGATPAASCSLNSPAVTNGNVVTVSWSSSHTSSCTLSSTLPTANPNLYTGSGSSYTTPSPIASNTTYNLSCVPIVGYSAPTCSPNSGVAYYNPPASGAITLKIGRTATNATTPSLAIKKGDAFALKWTNSGSGYTSCSALVSNGTWSTWTPLTKASLGIDGQLEGISSNAKPTGNYQFSISCTDGVSTVTSIPPATLKIQSSKIGEF